MIDFKMTHNCYRSVKRAWAKGMFLESFKHLMPKIQELIKIILKKWSNMQKNNTRGNEVICKK
jgi:hypothetical protein